MSEFVSEHPVLAVALAILALYIVVKVVQNRKKQWDIRPDINKVEELLGLLRENKENEIVKFANEDKYSKPNMWNSIVFWIAHTCADYQYNPTLHGEIIKLAEVAFSKDSLLYSKLVAAEKMVDTSTVFYLDQHKTLKTEKSTHWRVRDYADDRLYQMVKLFVDANNG